MCYFLATYVCGFKILGGEGVSLFEIWHLNDPLALFLSQLSSLLQSRDEE